jgi:hypothetical protein
VKLKLLIVLSLVLAACGGGAAASGNNGVASLTADQSGSTTSTTVDPEKAAQDFTQCMRDHGVEMSDPTVDANGNVRPGRPTNLPEPGQGTASNGDSALRQKMGDAFSACRDKLAGTTFGFDQADQTQIQDQLLKLAACLREQGFDVADPNFSNPPDPGSGGRFRGPLGLDFQDPKVQAALQGPCKDYVPNFRGGFGGGPGGGPDDNGGTTTNSLQPPSTSNG